LTAGLRHQVLPMFIVAGSQGRSGPRPQEFLEGEVCQDKVQDMKPEETIAFFVEAGVYDKYERLCS
jgi:hypothetical protein